MINVYRVFTMVDQEGHLLFCRNKRIVAERGVRVGLLDMSEISDDSEQRH